jgi:ferritin
MSTIRKFNKNFRINEDESFREIEAQDSEQPIEARVEGGIVNPSMLPEEIFAAFNERIGDEYAAHYFYRNAANWCRNANYKKATAFFEAEANSELDHAKGLQDYLTQWNMIPAIPAAATSHAFNGLAEIIGKAYQMEYALLLKYSQNQQEFLGTHPATFNFVQGYVNTQNDAVGEYSDLLNALQLVNAENKLDLLIFEDKYFG